MPRIGLFGGTFDPPHIGHKILAAEALHALQLDKVLWILTPHSPLKTSRNISPLDQRLELVDAAIKDVSGFELSLIDVNRRPPYYAVDTVKLLRHDFPGTDLVYIMGGDSLENLPSWHSAEKFVTEVDLLGVYQRPGYSPDVNVLETRIPGISQKIKFFDAPRIEISAADIRLRIRENRPYRFFVEPDVFNLIQKKGYYR